MLLAILTAQRQQTLAALNIEDMQVKRNKFIFHVNKLLKTNRPGHVGTTLELHAYPPDRRLCIYTYLTEYLKRSLSMRQNDKQLLISYKKPYKGVTVDTIARWLRTIMQQAGLDTKQFKPEQLLLEQLLPLVLDRQRSRYMRYCCKQDGKMSKHFENTITNQYCHLLKHL